MSYDRTVKSQAALIHKKFVKGEPLNDHEVKWGAEFYRKLADNLRQCGPAFLDAFNEANRVAAALEGFKLKRNI